jgi:hypothetical protein
VQADARAGMGECGLGTVKQCREERRNQAPSVRAIGRSWKRGWQGRGRGGGRCRGFDRKQRVKERRSGGRLSHAGGDAQGCSGSGRARWAVGRMLGRRWAGARRQVSWWRCCWRGLKNEGCGMGMRLWLQAGTSGLLAAHYQHPASTHARLDQPCIANRRPPAGPPESRLP